MKTWQNHNAFFLLNIAILLVVPCNFLNALNFCCDFDDNECKWSNSFNTGSWKWSIKQTPKTDGISDYEINASPNQWLQDVNLTATETAVKFENIDIHENDNVSIDFYRHTPFDNTDNKLKLLLIKNTGEEVTLLSSLNQGWTSMKIECKIGICCTTYPCLVQLQIYGTIDNPNYLLAFDNFRINDCA